MKGINIVSCLVRYGDVALPIGYETVKKDVIYSDIETRKQKRKSLVSKNDVFRSLIQQAVTNHVLFEALAMLQIRQNQCHIDNSAED